MFILQLNLKNFGRFHNQTIDLEKNINIIEGLNETGKTTIFNFIIGMFYGFVKPYIKTLRFEEEYYKYQPWESDQYNGSLLFCDGENTYRLNRDFKNRTYEIYNEDTGENVTDQLVGYELSNLSFPGEYFFKISSSVFRNTLFIHSINKDLDSKTIRELGDYLSLSNQEVGTYSYESACIFLESKKDEIGTKRALKKPYGQLISAKEKIKEDLKEALLSKNLYYESLEYIESLKTQLQKLEENKKSIENNKLVAAKKRLEKTYYERNQMYQEHQEIVKKLQAYDLYQRINPKEIQRLQEMHLYLDTVHEELSDLTKEKKQTYLDKKEIEDIIDDKIELIHAKEQYNLLSHRIEHEESMILSLNKYLVLSLVIAVGFSVISILMEMYLPIIFVLLFEVLFFVYFRYRRYHHQKIINEDMDHFNEIIHSTKNKHGINLSEDQHEDPTLFIKPTSEELERDAFLEDHLRKIDHRIDFLIDEEENISSQIEEEVVIFRRDHNIDLSKYDTIVREVEVLKERKKLIEDHIQRYDKEYDFSLLHEDLDIEWTEQSLEFNDPEEVDLRIRNCISELSTAEEKTRQLENAVHQVTENEEKLEQIQLEIKKMEVEKEAIDVALDAIQAANQKLHANYLPILNEELNKYLPLLTGEKRDYRIDGQLNVSMLSNHSEEFKTKEYFSQGTKDQVFIMLRLSIIKRILGENYLLIFDDAFSQYDDKRLERQLLLLNEMEKDRQIIIFTCQKRENRIMNQLDLKNHFVRLE